MIGLVVKHACSGRGAPFKILYSPGSRRQCMMLPGNEAHCSGNWSRGLCWQVQPEHQVPRCLDKVYITFLGTGAMDMLAAQLEKTIQNLCYNGPKRGFTFAMYVECHKTAYQSMLALAKKTDHTAYDPSTCIQHFLNGITDPALAQAKLSSRLITIHTLAILMPQLSTSWTKSNITKSTSSSIFLVLAAVPLASFVPVMTKAMTSRCPL